VPRQERDLARHDPEARPAGPALRLGRHGARHHVVNGAPEVEVDLAAGAVVEDDDLGVWVGVEVGLCGPEHRLQIAGGDRVVAGEGGVGVFFGHPYSITRVN
jgi:hypothetical protein